MNNVGWICPKCDGGVAPGVQRCPCFTCSAVPFYWPNTPWPQIYGPRSEDC